MGGGDKCLLALAGRPMLAHAVDRLGPQVAVLAISANGDPARFDGFGLPVLPDVVPDFAGPLAGILTGMAWLRQAAPHAEWLVTCATDTPFFPNNLAARLLDQAMRENASVAFAASNGRAHPVFGLWRLSLEHELRTALMLEHERKIDRFAGRYRVAEVTFEAPAVDPFFNVNRPEDLVEAARLSELVEQAAQA
jgi:molybdopterin-guanine dinucleotide biosynthesis protein A